MLPCLKSNDIQLFKQTKNDTFSTSDLTKTRKQKRLSERKRFSFVVCYKEFFFFLTFLSSFECL